MAFALPIRMYWEDTDAHGIVFYANYLTFFERARTEWLRSLGIEQQQLCDEVGGMFVVTQADIDYLRAARLDDMIEVTAALQSAGPASITIAQQAFLRPVSSNTAPQLLCEGTIRVGWVNSTTMRPTRIPKFIVEKLS